MFFSGRLSITVEFEIIKESLVSKNGLVPEEDQQGFRDELKSLNPEKPTVSKSVIKQKDKAIEELKEIHRQEIEELKKTYAELFLNQKRKLEAQGKLLDELLVSLN